MTVLWKLKVAVSIRRMQESSRAGLVEMCHTGHQDAALESTIPPCEHQRADWKESDTKPSGFHMLGKRSLQMRDLSRVRLKALACLLCAFAGHLWLLFGVLFFLSVSLSAARFEDNDRVVKLGLTCTDIGLAWMAEASEG